MFKKEARRFHHFEKEPGFRNDQENRVKKEICKYWESGKCDYGDKCLYAHGVSQIGEKQGVKSQQERCENYYKFGYCFNGSKCLFSHSQKEKKLELSLSSDLTSKNPQIAAPLFIDLEARNL
jgi:hypothetical protein